MIKLPDAVPTVAPEIDDPYVRTDGASFTHPYPGPNGKTFYHTFRIAKTVDIESRRTTSHLLIVMTSVGDPRSEDFVAHENDTSMVVPMTEAGVYGMMNLMVSLRTEMIPETAAMLSMMYEPGNYVRN